MDGLIKMMREGDSDLRVRAADALGEFRYRGRGAASELKGIIQSAAGSWRVIIARTLFKICPDDRASVGFLIEGLRDGSSEVRALAADTLEMCGRKGTDAVPQLLIALKDRSEDVRLCAAHALGTIRSDKAIPGLMAALTTDEAWVVRVAAANSLEEFGPRARIAIPSLRSALGDKNKDVRQSVRRALDAVEWPRREREGRCVR
jgi:HEAT repeat protein